MFLRLTNSFPADGVERAIADQPTAQRLLVECRPDVMQFLARRRAQLHEAFGEQADFADELERAESALMISLARFGMRHGSWGDDFHHYHNENHALEILTAGSGG